MKKRKIAPTDNKSKTTNNNYNKSKRTNNSYLTDEKKRKEK